MARLTSHAVESIRELILTDQLKQGERLREAHLADLTGASRTPVREALRRLEAEGLVEFEANRGARVASWSEHNVDEIYAMRALLEGFGASLAATRITAEQLDRLHVLAEEMVHFASQQGTGRLDEIARRNDEFHQLILNSSGNELLSALLATIMHAPIVMRTFRRFNQAALDRSVQQHRELVTALAAKDGAWASAIMQSHILAARNALRNEEAG